MLIRYHSVAMGLFFPYIPKKYKQTSIADFAQFTDS